MASIAHIKDGSPLAPERRPFDYTCEMGASPAKALLGSSPTFWKDGFSVRSYRPNHGFLRRGQDAPPRYSGLANSEPGRAIIVVLLELGPGAALKSARAAIQMIGFRLAIARGMARAGQSNWRLIDVSSAYVAIRSTSSSVIPGHYEY